MNRGITLLLAIIMLLSFAGCSKDEPIAQTETTEFAEPSKSEPTVNGPLTDSSSYDTLETKFQTEIESSLNALVAEWEGFNGNITNYSQYVANTDKIEAFYQKTNNTSENLCIKLCAYSIEYATAILASGKSADDMYEDLDGIYDAIYEDLADDIYDGIYDGLLKDDTYDAFYDGVLKKRPDEVEYSEWSDVRSNEYRLWSDVRSDTYEHWSDARSDVYGFWSDLRSELFGDDVDGARDEIEDFRKDVTKMSGATSTPTPAETTPSTQPATAPATKATTPATVPATKATTPATVPATKATQPATSEGKNNNTIDPDFKAAMDSYEKFFDEYVAIMKKYKANPTDLSILSDYATYMGQYTDMMQKFEKWENEDLNTAEAAYYVDVQARIAKKLLEVA